MTVKLLENIKTGRRFIATPELLKRADMRSVVDRGSNEAITTQVDDSDDDYLGGDDSDLTVVAQNLAGTGSTDIANNDDTGGDEANGGDVDDEGGDDDNETSGGTIDLSKFSDDDLIAFANAEPYKLGANKGWNRSTIESKLFALMGG